MPGEQQSPTEYQQDKGDHSELQQKAGEELPPASDPSGENGHFLMSGSSNHLEPIIVLSH